MLCLAWSRQKILLEKIKTYSIISFAVTMPDTTLSTAKDIIGKDKNLFIEKIMTRSPLVVKAKTSLAYVAHMMVWEGIEVVPIVDENSILLGLVSRQDVLKALQQVQRQPHVGEMIEDIVESKLKSGNDDQT